MGSSKLGMRSSRKVTDSWLKRLKAVESPDVTYYAERFPIVMKRARDLLITDVEGQKFYDFTACFGVLALGHRPKTTITATRKQSAQLIHGMGDVHPSTAKILFLEELIHLSPFKNAKAVLSLSGAEAVEAALKTAIVATGRHRFLSFEGAYHGLLMGSMGLAGFPVFRKGFDGWNADRSVQISFPYSAPTITSSTQGLPSETFFKTEHKFETPARVLEMIEEQLKSRSFAAFIIEVLQGRGGERSFPQGFLKECQVLCKKYGTVLIFDEVFTGLGRTGKMFALEHEGITPDLLCVGKALGGGLPLSACVGEIMDVWGKSEGEARHTSTFLGHPLACATGHATLKELKRRLPKFQSETALIEKEILDFVTECRSSAVAQTAPFALRGRGFMHGFWFFKNPAGFAVWLSEQLLERGFVVLPSGPRADVLSLSPPLTATHLHYRKILKAVKDILEKAPAHLRAKEV